MLVFFIKINSLIYIHILYRELYSVKFHQWSRSTVGGYFRWHRRISREENSFLVGEGSRIYNVTRRACVSAVGVSASRNYGLLMARRYGASLPYAFRTAAPVITKRARRHQSYKRIKGCMLQAFTDERWWSAKRDRDTTGGRIWTRGRRTGDEKGRERGDTRELWEREHIRII